MRASAVQLALPRHSCLKRRVQLHLQSLLSPSSPNGQNGWYTGSVSFDVTPPSETISGGVTCTWIPDYTGSDGTGLSFTSTCTDSAGLTSPAGTSPAFMFEATGPAAPTVSLSPGTPNGANGWYTGSVSFVVTAPAETISGGVTCTSIPDYTGPDGTGLTFTSTCTDSAGLTSPAGTSPAFMFEATGPAAPTVSLSPGSPNGQNGWYVSSVSFDVTPPSETISGGVTCTSIPDYTGPDGMSLFFSSMCTDNAGLTDSGSSPSFMFEATGPAAPTVSSLAIFT